MKCELEVSWCPFLSDGHIGFDFLKDVGEGEDTSAGKTDVIDITRDHVGGIGLKERSGDL